MQLENKFTIAAPIDKAWEALNTPQTVAPCFPGAALETYEGDAFTGSVKVKLGPISMTYKGKGAYILRDDEAHKIVIEASGRDSRGNGTANATVTGTLVAEGPDKTAVTMVTDMTVTGRPAQFGRGVMSDVADKIIGRFATCVAEKLAPQPPSGSGPAPTEGTTGTGAGGSSNGSGGGGGAGGTVTRTAAAPVVGTAPAATGSMRSEIDALDLLDSAGAPVLKRLAPVVGGVLLLLLLLAFRRRRRS